MHLFSLWLSGVPYQCFQEQQFTSICLIFSSKKYIIIFLWFESGSSEVVCRFVVSAVFRENTALVTNVTLPHITATC